MTTQTTGAPRQVPRPGTDWDDPAGAAIFCRDLVRVYATEGVEVQALQGLSLRVEPGELVAIVGESGSGKSTLLSILSGIDRPTAGLCQVAGQNIVTMTRAQRVSFQRTAVGFVWQQTARNLLPYLTGAENIGIVLAVAGHRRRRTRISELLELTGAADQAGKLPGEMSGGQQQRVAIAVALANAPQVLLADEPTGELDDAATELVLSTLREVNERTGTTTVIVTHDAAVSGHVRRTIRIRDGRIAAETFRHGAADSGPQVEELLVLDRLGRLQLPPESLRRFGLRDHVQLDDAGSHLRVLPRAELNPDAVGDSAVVAGPARPPDPVVDHRARHRDDTAEQPGEDSFEVFE